MTTNEGYGGVSIHNLGLDSSFPSSSSSSSSYLSPPSALSSSSAPPSSSKNWSFKLILAGDSEVGKSCLMTRFVEDRFSDIHVTTIGYDYQTVVTMVEGKIVKLHIWDTCGQERYASLGAQYYRNTDGAILVYDISNAKSFENIESWWEHIVAANGDWSSSSSSPSTSVVALLIGNKNDLSDKRQVSQEQGWELARRLGAPFIETSAKDAVNVDVGFLNLAKHLVLRRAAQQQQLQAPSRRRTVSDNEKPALVLVNDSNDVTRPCSC